MEQEFTNNKIIFLVHEYQVENMLVDMREMEVKLEKYEPVIDHLRNTIDIRDIHVMFRSGMDVEVRSKVAGIRGDYFTTPGYYLEVWLAEQFKMKLDSVEEVINVIEAYMEMGKLPGTYIEHTDNKEELSND